MKAHVRFEHELLAVESEHDVACMLELTAPAAPATTTRLPLHVALVIDRSGSMAGRKLEVTRRCAAFLLEHLAPTAQLSIVTYDDQVELRAPLQQVGPHREQLRAAIEQIHSGGQTNLSGGWLKGAETLGGLAPDAGPRRVLLLSDGMANVGITDPAVLAGLARTAAERESIGTTTIGFGEGFDEVLMTQMADAGRGSAHFAETPDDAPGIFAAEFSDLVALVAQNVSVEIRPLDQVQLVGILNDQPTVPVPGGLQVQLGDAYGEESRRIVFRLHVPALAALGPAKIADVVLRYVTVGDVVAQHQTTVPLVVNAVSSDDALASVPDAEVTEEVVVLLAAKAQAEARELADRGEFESAQKLLREAAGELRRKAPDSARADELMEQVSELEGFDAAMDPAMYDPTSRKKMLYSQRARQRRSSQARRSR